MESAATYCATIYPSQCDRVGHMNVMRYVGKFDKANWNLFARIGLTLAFLQESERKSAPFPDAIRKAAESLLYQPSEGLTLF